MFCGGGGSKSAKGGPNPLADMDRGGPNPLADMDRGGPNPLADLDRGGPNPREVQIRCDTGLLKSR